MIGEVLFRLLLALYPPRVRHRFGAEMLEYMRASRARARSEGRRARFWLVLCADTVRALPGAWAARGATSPPSVRRAGPVLGPFAADLRHAVRALTRRPGFALAVVLTLTLGIGASSAVLSLVNGILLAPLPYPEPERLVRLFQENAAGFRWGLSVVEYQAVAEQQRTLEAVAAVERRVVVVGSEQPESLLAAFVTADFFRVAGVQPAAGRAFSPGEDAPGSDRTVVLGHAIAERLLGGAGALGSTVTIDGHPHVVIGVLPPGMVELLGERAAVWPILQLGPPPRRGPFNLRAYARLRADRSSADAGTELAAISERIFPLWADTFHDETATLMPVPLREAMVGRLAPRLTLAFAAVMAVLLVAVANVANLLLARATERRRELALRTALGAGRGQLLRWMLAESLVLSTAGGLAGLALAAAALAAFRTLGPSLPRLGEVGVDGAAVAFTATLVAVASLLLGVVPLAGGAAVEPAESLRAGGRGSAGGRAGRLRSALVVLEFAMTLPLLLAAGLLLSSLLALQRVDPGFDADGVSALHIMLPSASYPDDESQRRFWHDALAAATEVPGVVAAGASLVLPPDAYGFSNNFDLVDRPVEPGQPEHVSPWTLMTGHFLEALGVPLLEGRLFEAEDFTAGGPPVMIVSAAWAQRFYPGESAVGRQVYSGGDHQTALTVVGVVGDVKFEGLAGGGEAVYSPATGGGWLRSLSLLVRVRDDAGAILEPLRATLRAIAPGIPLTDVTTMRERIDASTAAPRQWTLLLGAFAAATMALSAVGIFGVVAYTVRAQTREIGVRMALGASTRGVVGLVVRRAMLRAAAGMAAGLLASAFTARWLESLLYGVTPGDPTTLVAVCALLAAVALLACWLPGRRAARIDPVAALAAE